MADDPTGLACPGCGKPPMFLFGGGHQAFCGSDDCRVLTWDPAQTVAEFYASAKITDLRGEDEYCEHICDEECEDYQGFSQCLHQHCMNCGGCTCPGYCDNYVTYNLRPDETGG